MRNGLEAMRRWLWAAVPAGLCALVWLSGCIPEAPRQLTEEDRVAEPERGKTLVSVYGCAACHQIPGVSGNPGNIGPPLTQWSRRRYIAGKLPNELPMLIQWLRNPQEVEPGTAMPDLGVSERDALDMAAYLYSL